MPYYIKRKPKTPKSGIKERKPSTAALVRKLDKVFSLYIRLRDSAAYNYQYFRCISCGQIKPFEQMDCGHFISRTHQATRFDEENAHGECRFCLTPDALILTADLRWIPLGEVKEGDELFGFTEESHGRNGERRHWKKSIVTHIHRATSPVYDVELENGDHIKTTAEHKWLVRSKGGTGWIETQEMWINGYNLHGKRKTGPHTEKTTTIVCKPIMVCQQEKSYEAGWLAGMIDADGHLCQQNIHDPDGSIRYGLRIGVAQSETYPEICADIVKWMGHFTGNHKPCRQWMERPKNGAIKSKVQTWQFLVTGSNIEKVQFLMKLRPHKLKKLDIEKLGDIRSKYDTKVKSITPAGIQEIVVMETSTHTFIANGYMMHNCNRFSADHIIAYQRNLEAKIGKDRVDMLLARGRMTKKWSAFELQLLIKHYQQEVDKMQGKSI